VLLLFGLSLIKTIMEEARLLDELLLHPISTMEKLASGYGSKKDDSARNIQISA
jgi:hypothetical protein